MIEEQDIVPNQFWLCTKITDRRIKVMAVKDKYAMVRVKGCTPFVISFDSLRKTHTPIPIQKHT